MNAIRLASRFNYNRVNIAPNAVGGISRLCGASQEAYSEDVLRQFVPSIFAETAHESRSARYGYVPTIEVVRGLADEGFKPVFACEARARDESKAGFTKHMIRFRHQDVIGKDMAEKPTKAPVANEAKNGLKNLRGTIAMARRNEPHSATAQFFINHRDNAGLDYPAHDGWGYAVFGKVTQGMDVVDKIAKVPTGNRGFHQNVPNDPVIVQSVKVLSDK